MDGTIAPAPAESAGSSSTRLPLLAFVSDSVTAATLREGLSELVPGGFEVRSGTVATALQALGRMTTPNVLVIDVSGTDQPLAMLADLRMVVEPHVKVMVIGDRQDVTFYRQVTRTLGVAEYLYKPLNAEMVARHFGAQIVDNGTALPDGGGRLVCVAGARGGVGTSTIAANLAWYIATVGRRHAMLLDADVHAGTTAMLLGSTPGPGLRLALETPDRVDELFVERSAIAVCDRLHLLASESALTEALAYRAGAAERLSIVMRRRFNYVVADTPFHGDSFTQDLLMAAQQRVLVLLPTLASVRDTIRMMSLRAGTGQARRNVLVLNRAGMPGGLARAAVEDSLGCKVDLAIPDLPRPLGLAESLGEPAAKSHVAFRASIAALAREVGSIDTAAPAGRRWWRR